MIWLGATRGTLSDWTTQRWVQWTGRRVELDKETWLAGPGAPTTGIGPEYFSALASSEGLQLQTSDDPSGILENFTSLRGPSFDPARVDPRVIHFYEKTSVYELDAWAEWRGLFRPFGWMLAVIFSRRLRQLNVPLSGLDTSRGMTNEVVRFMEPATGTLRYTAWFRRLRGTGRNLYVGFYSAARIPACVDPVVKVVFPLPNGNAIVLMRTEALPDGSFRITSAGDKFGDPGFYFVVHDGPGVGWARYVRTMRESIHAYPAADGEVRADHLLTYFRASFLRLHYRMKHARSWSAGGEHSPPGEGTPTIERKPSP